MEKRIGYRSVGKLFAAAAACGLVGVAASQADASLVIDIRATAVNGLPLNAESTAKSVIVLPGDVVTFGVFAQATGQNGTNDEQMQGVTGVFQSSSGGLLGDLVSHTTAGFSALGSQQGSQVDIDSDGDLDIGIGPNTPTTNSNTVFQARSAALDPNGAPLSPNSEEWEIGSLTFAVKAGSEGESNINFFVRRNPNGTNNLSYGTWQEDGTTAPPGNKNPTNSTVTGSGAVVSVGAVPEPTGLALAGIAGFGLLARRRNKNA